MKYLLMILMVIAATQATASGVFEVIESLAARAEETALTSEVEVIELFHAETTEELEAVLTDGYPMPWLEEILNDESIPEEDRYWLDCRVRAVYAQDLHLFFNEQGNPVHVEADYIGPGEDYWREHMMVNPLGETDVPDENRPTRPAGEPGYILNLYGERVGDLATVHSFVSLSRDASIAAIPSDYSTVGVSLQTFACFMYPDGSFKEIPFERRGNYEAVVSANGEVIVFQCTSPSGLYDPETYERTGIVGDILFYDPEGNLVNSVSPPVLFSPGYEAISATGRYVCNRLSTGEMFLVNCAEDYSTSLIGMSEGGRGRSAFDFSPDGNYLCAGGFSTGMVLDLIRGDTVWVSDNEFVGINDNVKVHCSNAAECIVSTTQHGDHPNNYYELEVILNNTLIYTDTVEGLYRGEAILSPSGYFLLSRRNDAQIRETIMQTIIRQIRREG